MSTQSSARDAAGLILNERTLIREIADLDIDLATHTEDGMWRRAALDTRAVVISHLSSPIDLSPLPLH